MNKVAVFIPEDDSFIGASVQNIPVSVGDILAVNALVVRVLKSDSTCSEVLSEHRGRVVSVHVSQNERVFPGRLLVTLEVLYAVYENHLELEAFVSAKDVYSEHSFITDAANEVANSHTKPNPQFAFYEKGHTQKTRVQRVKNKRFRKLASASFSKVLGNAKKQNAIKATVQKLDAQMNYQKHQSVARTQESIVREETIHMLRNQKRANQVADKQPVASHKKFQKAR